MDKVWLKEYQKGVPHEIDPKAYGSLSELAEECFKIYAQKPAYTCMGKTLTYDDIEKSSRAFGAYLTGTLALKAGDRVALMMPNILQYPICMYGALRAGLVVVNVNPLYTPRELKHQLADSGASVIVIVENFASVLEEVLKETQIKHILTTTLGEQLDWPKSVVVDFVIKHVKKMVPAFHLPTAIPLKKALSVGAGLGFKQHKRRLDDTAFLQYTGGTTGVSKGAMLTHGNLVANIEQAYAWLSQYMEKGKEMVITALPLYHIFSLTANCFTFLKIGGQNILIPNPRDIPGFIKTLKSYPFTAFTGVNTLFNALLNNPLFKTVDFSSLKLTLGGGMAVQSIVAKRWREVTNSTLVQAYGLTETSPAAIINPLNVDDFSGAIGVPISSTEVIIRDDDGKEVALGEPGELCIKGPQVMKGYWQREAETKEVLSGGWLRTGDIASIDARGYVKIVDRKKDMIIVSGFNVYPSEIEEIVVSLEGIVEAAAIGIENEKSGEAVKVFAVKSIAELCEKDIIDHCRKHLTGYKIPKEVEFRDELPKTNVGKILRRALKKPL